MKNSLAIKSFYLFGILLIIGEVFEIQILKWFPRVCMLPLLYFVYYKKTTLANWGISIVFLFYFFAELSSFFNQELILKYSLIFFGLGHLVLCVFAFNLIHEKGTKRLLYYSIPIILLWLVYYEFYLRDAFGDALGILYPYVVGYSVALVMLNVLSNVSFFNSGSQLTLYLIIIAVSLVIGDSMMSMYLFFSPINLFEVINVISHIISYIFLLKFATDYEGFKLKSTYLP
ncbi:hypothetical protein [Ascidiimonas sp. W6]|uniref:hypothetical protein n=1 Tax=Ascidiimonas meishanensis TaxID=3128903 RepID=UPI0030ED1D3A